MSTLLEVKNLCTYFETQRGTVRAVDGVDFTLNEGDTLGVVGESGCGKTVLALSIMRLVPRREGSFPAMSSSKERTSSGWAKRECGKSGGSGFR